MRINIYGAEIKRLLFTAEQTAKLMEATKASQVVDDPEGFAERVGELASKAGELASQVTNKASDEEAPLSRKNLEKTGDDLRERSERIVELGNEVLADPDDVAKRAEFDAEVKRLEKDMKAATSPMKEKLSEITRSNVENVFQNMTAEPPIVAREASPKLSCIPSFLNLLFAGWLILCVAHSRVSTVRHDADFAAPAVTAVIDENAALSEVARAAIRRDPANISSAAQALAARTEDLVDKCKYLLILRVATNVWFSERGVKGVRG